MLPSPPAYSESRGSSKVIMRGGLSGVSRFALGSYLVFLCSSSCGILSQRGQELPPSLLLSKNARVATTPFLTGGQAGRLRIYVCIYLGSILKLHSSILQSHSMHSLKRTSVQLTGLLFYCINPSVPTSLARRLQQPDKSTTPPVGARWIVSKLPQTSG